MTLHIETPLLRSDALSDAAGCVVELKLESLQPSGSFKLRGIGHACEVHAQRGARRFLSSSGGNAGLAVAFAGRRLGLPVIVVVPETTTERARRTIIGQHAELIVHGTSWQEAHALALSVTGAHDALIHPFDDPLLWTGHASMVDEIARQGGKPDAIVLSVGGGGLLCGVVEGLQRNGWSAVPIVAVETRGADSLARSLAAGTRVTLDAITSVATSLGAKQVAAQAFDVARRHPLTSVVVDDAAAVAACLALIDDHRLVVEPACGAALAVARGGALAAYGRVVVVVCGGVTATVDQLRTWSEALPVAEVLAS